MMKSVGFFRILLGDQGFNAIGHGIQRMEDVEVTGPRQRWMSGEKSSGL